MLVFVDGDWKEVASPVGSDPTWSADDHTTFAVVFAKLRALAPKLSAMRCEQIAEAYVSKQKYHGTTFDSDLETAISWLKARA